MNSVVPHHENAEQARGTLHSLYSRILETGERDSAMRIWEACEFLSKGRTRAITTAAVGDYCQAKFGGPKAQSITNKQGSLALIVRYWDVLHQIQIGRSGKRSGKDDKGGVIIDDPVIGAYVDLLRSEIKELRASNERLNRAFREMQPLQIGRVNEGAEPAQPAMLQSFATDVQKEAIRVFLGKAHLDKFGLAYDGRGRIMDGRRVLVERPVIEALQKLIGSSDYFDENG